MQEEAVQVGAVQIGATHEIETHLARIKARWLIGGTAAEQTPPEWRDLVGTGAEAELRLVALVGQAAQVAFRPRPGAELSPSPALPPLALPSLPEPARARFRRMLGSLKPNKERMAAILALLSGRGYVTHPADWMPGPGEEALPSVYAPWIDWQSAQEAESPQEELSLENWDLWYPAERRAALRELRLKDPAAAAALVSAKAPEVKADQRVRLVELFTVGLSEADVPFLEGLSGDRSAKVKDLAARLLARLGKAEDSGEAVAELADFLKVGTSGLLARSKAVTAKKLKTSAQRSRRRQLFETVTLSGLSRALGMTELELVQAWSPTRDSEATEGFVTMVADTGSDAVQRPCLDRLLEESSDALTALLPLADRLDQPARREVAARILSGNDLTFEATVFCAGEALGRTTIKEIQAAPGYRALMANLKAVLADEASRWRQEEALLAEGLANLGLLAEQSAAADLLDRISAAGLMAADPKLDLLHLNAALAPALERRPDHE